MEKRGSQFPGMYRVCGRPGWPDYAVLVSRTEPMVKAGAEVFRCAYPGCENGPLPGKAGAAKQEYCGLPGPVTGEPRLAPTWFGWR